MRPLPAGDPSQRSGTDGRVEARQRGVSGEEDRLDCRACPRDLQAYLRRGLRCPGSGRDPGSARLDGRHRPARPAAVRPAGGRHVRLGQESGKCRCKMLTTFIVHLNIVREHFSLVMQLLPVSCCSPPQHTNVLSVPLEIF